MLGLTCNSSINAWDQIATCTLVITSHRFWTTVSLDFGDGYSLSFTNYTYDGFFGEYRYFHEYAANGVYTVRATWVGTSKPTVTRQITVQRPIVTLQKANYIGCFLDEESRDLDIQVLNGSITNDMCLAECQRLNYFYASTQAG
jgi:hypothetical protein